MTVLPQKPGGKNYETYDSSSDNPGNPNMFIIFHDSQAYPTYHIVFKWIQGDRIFMYWTPFHYRLGIAKNSRNKN